MKRLLDRLSPDRSRLLQPGLRLMNALSMRAKLSLVAVCLMAPTALLTLGWVADTQQRVQMLQQMRQGLATYAALGELQHLVQQHRGLALRAGDPGAEAPRVEVRQALAGAVAAVGQSLSAQGSTEQSGAWASLAPRIAALARPAEAEVALAAHNEASDALDKLARLTAEQSTLLLDPDAVGYFHVELLVTGLPPLTEGVSRSASVGAALLSRPKDAQPSLGERLQLLAGAATIDRSLQRAQLSVAAVQRAGARPPATWTAMAKAVDDYSTLLRDAFSPEHLELPAAALNASALEASMQLRELQKEATQAMAASLDSRLHGLRTQQALATLAFAAGLLLSLYLIGALVITFRQSLTVLLQSTQAVASGDLSTRLDLPGSDELSTIGRTVNGMNERLSELVGEIRSSAARVNMAGAQVADGSQRLAARTEEQASSLRESVEVINQLSSAVQDNARAARELDTLTEQLSVQAGEGHQAMGETIAAVEKLQTASRRVFEVVSVIDDVAFQTSMLSLNAAVEAARAGEAGRGFSLVASEVRTLAQRVGESADEIRALITQAGDHLQFSGSKLGSANGALEGVVHGVRDVSQRLREIANASTEQSDTLVSVARRVGDLDQITRDNARLVDESTHASQALLERAQVLRDAVSSMRLRQGSADEARELLDRAFGHVQMVGTEAGLQDLHDPAHGFIDRDLYVFALDRDGLYVACGAKPQLVGTSVNDLPGIRGTPFVDEAWKAAESGGGWVQYEISNPLTGEVTPKESYMLQLDERLLLGCGVYRRATTQGPGIPRAAAWSHKQESAEVAAY